MSISSRLEETLESWSAKWKGRLAGWMASWLMGGINNFLASNEAESIGLAQDNLNKIRDHPDTPQEIKDLINKLTAGTQPIPVILLVVIAAFMVIPMVTAISAPLGRLLEYVQDRLLHSARLDPIAVITAWRRDPALYNSLFDDLRDLGWSEERIEALKFVTLIFPSRQDLIRYAAKEALEPESITKYGLLDEFDRLDLTLFDQIGVSRDTAKLDWIAHWEHPPLTVIIEMLHRGLQTEQDVTEYFRLIERPPYWRAKEIETYYTWPTRVDVRRWWDMRTIDEAELRRLYSGMGYRGANLENYLLWTKVYVAFPDLIARWRNGWITLDDVRAELTGLGMPADRVEEMIQTKIEPIVQDPINEGKKVTQTSIIKWVKEAPEERWEQGVDLLMDLGYNDAGARFTLEAYIAELGSPETYEEWKGVTQGYRKAVGQPSKPVTEELKKAAAELTMVTKEVESLREAVKAEEKTLIQEEILPGEASKKRDELRVSLHRAEAELSRVQTDYNALVAEWKFKESE